MASTTTSSVPSTATTTSAPSTSAPSAANDANRPQQNSHHHQQTSHHHQHTAGTRRGNPRFRHYQNNRGSGRSRGGSKRPFDTEELPASNAPPPSEPSALQKALSPAQDAVTAEDGETHYCFICTEPIAIFAVAACNHRTCHLCSLRLRALYKTRNCAYCKTEQATVILTALPDKPFQDYTAADTPYTDKKLDARFETLQMHEDVMILLRFNCPEPTCDVACEGGWSDLKRHVKKVHGMLLCDLCTRHKKIFSHEHTLFTANQLEKHYTQGFENNRDGDSSGFTGHPECGFCRLNFYGDDELYEHCRDKHEQCHVCVRLGIRHQYYANYESLAKHFRNDHFMCQNPECLEKKFVVFGSDIDLKAHEVEAHGGSASHVQRAKQREARKVEVNFQYSSGPSNQRDHGRERDRGRDRDRDRDRDRQHESGHGTVTTTTATTQQPVVNAFPQLNDSGQTSQTQNQRSVEAVTNGVRDLNVSPASRQQQQQQGGDGNRDRPKTRHKQQKPTVEGSGGSTASEGPPAPVAAAAVGGERRGVAARAPAGFGALTLDTPEGERRGVAARAPAGFGTLTLDTPGGERRGVAARAPAALTLDTPGSDTDAGSNPAALSKPATPVDPETAKQHAALLKRISGYLSNDTERVQRFRQLTSGYRNSILAVDHYIDSLVQLFGGNLDITGKVVQGLVELLDHEDKKSEVMRAWKDRKLMLQSQTEDFPSLGDGPVSYSALASGAVLGASSAFPSLPASAPAKNVKSAPRILVIKSGSTRAGGTRASSSKSIWDKVAAAASSPQREPSPGPGASRPPTALFPTPQIGLSASGTAWATGGTAMSRAGGSSGGGEAKQPQFVAPVRSARDEFPSLPNAVKPVGRGSPALGPKKSNSQTDLPVWRREEEAEQEEEEDEIVSQKKGKKKQKKQMLFHVGL